MSKYYGLTDEESDLITDAVVLPMVLAVVQKNKQNLEVEKLSLRKLYLIATDVLIGRIMAEKARVKKELWKQRIKVIGPSPADPLGYAYVCRGLSNNLVMSREEAQREISARLNGFVSNFSTELSH